MVNYIKRFLRYHDWFGYKVALNFHNHGSNHGTSIGGLVSLALEVVFIFYTLRILARIGTT